MIASMEGAITKQAVDLSVLIQKLSEKALARMEQLMEGAGKEEIQFRAAQDLLDRNPETSKTHKIQSMGLSLSGQDVQALVKAMTSSAGMKEEFAEAATGDYVPAELAT